MNSTEKLFYQDTHIVDFTGTVLECTALENDSFRCCWTALPSSQRKGDRLQMQEHWMGRRYWMYRSVRSRSFIW